MAEPNKKEKERTLVGALKPWHVVVVGAICCLGTTGVIAAVLVLVLRRKK